MKKLLFAIAIFAVSFSSFGSYRTSICNLRGTTDTTVVTLKERIDYCIKENCFKVLRGTIAKTSIDQNTTFTDAQLTEFCLRGTRGAITDYITPGITASAAYIASGTAVTDTQLDSALLYLIWPICKLIGQGSL
jgi:hypothetical protein